MDRNPVILSPFELDIAAQPDALREFARASPSPSAELAAIARRDYDRIVFTGMGSSHFAALPSWRQLVADGRSTWRVDTGQLLDIPRLITEATLLVITSQSGASGEIAALLSPAEGRQLSRPLAVVGITNDPGSPLGRASDAVILLHSGPEATVSTKSYLNSLAAHQQLLYALIGTGTPDSPAGAAQVVSGLSPVSAAAGAGPGRHGRQQPAHRLHRHQGSWRHRPVRRPDHQGGGQDRSRGLHRRPVPARPPRAGRPRAVGHPVRRLGR